MTKNIHFLAIASVLVVGIVSADYVLAAKDDTQGQPFVQLEQKVDSFFDVFTELKANDASQQAQIDTFVEIVDTQTSTTSVIAPLDVPLAEGYFIKFDGIDGESQDKDHKNWSNLGSFSQGQFQTTTDTRRSGGPVLEDIVVVKELDKSSPKLAEAALKGKVFSTVEIHVTASFTDAGRVTYYAYELKNVQIVSYGISGSGQDNDIPVEQVSLNFEEIKVTYTELDERGKSKGNVEYTWKVEEGERL